MDYKEKYEKALERAKAKMEEANGFDYDDEQTAHVIRLTTTDIFPELAESENEKIRKAIKKALQVRCDGSRIISDEPVTLEEAISWLEKQGEQKPKELFDIPENGIENDVSVTSRLEHISEQLKPIAKFILHYAHWNLHKDEWNHPVPEVPLFRVLDALVQEGKPYQGCDSCIEQKFAWNEEDEKFVHGLIRGLVAKRDIHGHTTFSSDCIDITETISWLKSIKDRCLPQQSEWSEEDEHRREDAIYFLETAKKHYASTSEIELTIDWLKSLRPQKQWKPSEEQIKTLEYYMHTLVCNKHKEVLFGLMEQLKAL